MNMGQRTTPPLRDRLAAIGTLLMEVIVILFIFACFVSFLDGLGMLFEYYAFGHSWSWVREHFMGRLLLWFLMSIPILLFVRMVWILLRDEYRAILRIRMRKW